MIYLGASRRTMNSRRILDSQFSTYAPTLEQPNSKACSSSTHRFRYLTDSTSQGLATLLDQSTRYFFHETYSSSPSEVITIHACVILLSTHVAIPFCYQVFFSFFFTNYQERDISAVILVGVHFSDRKHRTSYPRFSEFDFIGFTSSNFDLTSSSISLLSPFFLFLKAKQNS